MNPIETFRVKTTVKHQTKALADVRNAIWDAAGPLWDEMMAPVKEEIAYYRTSRMYLTIETWCMWQTREEAVKEFYKTIWGNKKKPACLAKDFSVLPPEEVPGEIVRIRHLWLECAEARLEKSLDELQAKLRQDELQDQLQQDDVEMFAPASVAAKAEANPPLIFEE